MRISDWSSDVCSSDLEEAGAVPQREWHQDEAGQRGQLELDNRHEHLHREDEEGDDHDRPGEQQHGDRQEIVEEGREPHQLRDLLEQWQRRREASARQSTGLQERSEVHTSELQSLMRISYACFCLKKKKQSHKKKT